MVRIPERGFFYFTNFLMALPMFWEIPKMLGNRAMFYEIDRRLMIC